MKDIEKKQHTQAIRRQEQETLLPAADIWETPEEIILKLDMPGVGKDDLDIKVEGDTLAIHGKVQGEMPDQVLYAEHRPGDYRREFSLSGDLDQNKISAAMNAGVLTVKIAKAEKVKPKRIAIAAE
jgi:HSP20 family protein